MRILYLGNNWLGWQVLQWLRQQRVEVAGLVLHPEARLRYGAEITREVPGVPAFDGSRLGDPRNIEAVRGLGCDMAVSILFGYILRPQFLSLFPNGCLNLHPSLLPYNRGAHPNVWSIVEGTPAGVTLHYIDAGVDTGDIVAQREVPVKCSDTGKTLYHRLECTALDLFKQVWPAVVSGTAPRLPQKGAVGTAHRARDLERIDEIDLEANYKARDLINVMRARTFPPYPGAFFRSEGRKIFVRLELTSDQEANGD